MILYSCLVCDCHECWQESIHKTKRGAYFAGRKWLIDRFNQGYESRAMIGKSPFDFMSGSQMFIVSAIEVQE